MKKILYLFIQVFYVSSFYSCNSDDPGNELTYSNANNDKTISLQQVDTIVLNAGDRLFGKFREGLRVDSSGEVLSFADDGNQFIYLFSRHGDLINFIGGKGSGPEEFLQISGYFVENDRLVVVDESQLIAKVFDIDGTLLNTFSLFDNQNMYINSRDIFVDDDTLYIQILEADKFHDKTNSKLVARYDLSTAVLIDLIGQYEPFLDEANSYLTFHNFTVDTNSNQLISTLVSSPRIQVFDLQTSDKVSHFVSSSSYWKNRVEKIEPGMSRREIMRRGTDTSYSTGIFATNSYILNHIQTLTDAWMKTSEYLSKENYVSVYNSTGSEYYGTIELPGTLGDVHQEQLYIIEDFNPDKFTIGVYEIQMD